MSTPNFSFKNRCILITNDDIEWGNCPAFGKWSDGDRNYPSTEVKECEGFTFWKVVITPGYYSDACLDYIETDADIFDKLNYLQSLAGYTRRELIDEIQYFFPNVSTRRILRELKGCNVRHEDYESELESAIRRIEDWVRNDEEKEVVKMVESIKKRYGYRELGCTAVFSNGEAMYDYID